MKKTLLLTLLLTLSPAAFFDVSRAAEIRSGVANKCLDVSGRGSGGADGTPIVVWSCWGGENQKWAVGPPGFILGFGDKCLDVSGGGSGGADGTPIILWRCLGGPNQKWVITNGEIRGFAGKCLDVSGGGSGGLMALLSFYGRVSEVTIRNG